MQVGRYQVLDEVGRGGAGAVYRAVAPDGRPVALKLLLAGAGATPAQRARLMREAQAMLRLSHPGVVRLLDAGERQGVPWLALEWVEGESLQDRLDREGRLDPRDAARLVARLAVALEHCHAQGVVHRDLKPANVLLRRDGQPLLTDFGLALELDPERSTFRTRLTVAGALLGTPGYWPPEQAEGALERIGPASDVWGLGAILFAALTGRPPFAGESLIELIRLMERGASPPSQVAPGVPPELDAICLRCLQRQPGDRYARPGLLAQELQRWLAEASGQRQGWRSRGERQGHTPLVLAGLLALTTGALLLVRELLPAAAVSPAATPLPERPQPGTPPSAPPADALAQAREWIARGEEHARRGEPEQALAAFEQAIAAAPHLPMAWVGRGSLRSSQGDREQALADLQRALALDPQCAEAYMNRGNLRMTSDPAAALADYERTLALQPENPLAHLNRAVLRGRAGDRAGARADFDRAVALAPGLPAAWLYRGLVRLDEGDPGGEEDLERVLSLAPAGREATLARQGLARLGPR